MHNKVARDIKVAFFLNLIFSIIELTGGILTNSISIMSDAVHDFGDSLSIGISYLCEKKAKKRPNNKYTFGYLRFSLIGALITSIVLIISSILVVVHAIPRLINPVVADYNGMIILALLGVIINGLAAYKTAKAQNINEEAINLHLLEDVFNWVSVLIGSLIMKFFDLPIIDPILSIIIAIYILIHALHHIKEVFEIFLDKIPEDIDLTVLKKDIKSLDDSIVDIHTDIALEVQHTRNLITRLHDLRSARVKGITTRYLVCTINTT